MRPLKRLRAIFLRRRIESEMAEEMQHHLELRTEKNLKFGMTPEEASHSALRAFGGTDQLKEHCRDVRSVQWLDTFLRNLRHSSRALAKSPGFTATALATFAICLGANLAIFAVVDAVLLRPLPFDHADRLVSMMNSYPRAGQVRATNSIANYFDRRTAIPAFSSLSIYKETSVVIGTAEYSDRVEIATVSADFFTTLGVQLAQGRYFTEAEMLRGSDNVAIITNGFWRSYFNSDPDVVGRTFRNNGVETTVVGILAPSFYFPSGRAQFYRPIPYGPFGKNPWMRHTANGGPIVARLAQGATLADAQAQMDAFNTRQLKDDPIASIIKDSGYRTVIRGFRDDFVGEIRPTLLVLGGGVGCLFLIGAVNLTNLLLIRASVRSREMAVRRALGAGRKDIILSVMLETALLVLGGEVLGLVLGSWGIHLLRILGSGQLPLGDRVAFDMRMAAASFVISVIVWLLIAVPLAGFNLRTDATRSLQSCAFGATPSRAMQRLRSSLIIAQVAFAFVLLTGAGLLSVSLKRVLQMPTGFGTDDVLTCSIALPAEKYKDNAANLEFVQRLIPAIEAIPGVEQCAISSGAPFTRIIPQGAVSIEGMAKKPDEAQALHYLTAATAEYWQIMGIPLIRGRFLREADDQSKDVVCVVDQSFARHYWPGRDPIGKRISMGLEFDKDHAVTVVGVVGDVKLHQVTEDAGTGLVYFPYSYVLHPVFSLVVRSQLQASVMAPMLRKAVRQLDPDLPIVDLRPMQALYDESLVGRRSPAIVASIFAAIALILAALGTFGVLSYAVTQRQREIGVRLALGAQPASIGWLFLASGFRLVALGSAIGFVGAWSAGRAMQGILYGTPPFNGTALVSAGAILALVAIPASFLPALRAAKVDPATVLRSE